VSIPSPLDDESLPADLVLRIDQVCDRFEAELRQGRRARVENFLTEIIEPGRGLLLHELVAVELAYDRPPARLADWRQRFPEDVELLRDLFPLEAHAGAGGAPQPSAIAGYEILGELSRGADALVQRARHQASGRVVALKIWSKWFDEARCARETAALLRLNHPHIVRVFDARAGGETPYLAMELIDGGTLVQRTGPWPPSAAVRFVELLARAVSHMHERPVVHGHLRPEHILLTNTGTPKIAGFHPLRRSVLDLDVADARLAYQAPELALGSIGAPRPSVDIYALGAILYELLTGRRPFAGDNWLDLLRQVRGEEPLPPSRVRQEVPRELDAICQRCLRKKPEQRYPRAAALAEELLCARFVMEPPPAPTSPPPGA
jgi:eukaryotic-like serine/threonine-protein kinase